MSAVCGAVEVVQVTEDDDVRVLVLGHDLVDEPAHHGRLLVRFAAVTCTGGWNRPHSGSSPPLEPKWFDDHEHRLAVPA